MAVWSETVKIHGEDVPHHPQVPPIYAKVSVDSVSRSGETVTAKVSATLIDMGGTWYYYYNLEMAVSIGTGSSKGKKKTLFKKPDSVGQWDSKTYKGTKSVSIKTTKPKVTLYVWLRADCTGCNNKDWVVVAKYSDKIPVPPATYTVKYDANGGTGAPGNQTKTAGTDLTLSSTTPSKSYKLTYDANGGTLPSGTSNPVSRPCTFNNWKSSSDSKVYEPGATYTLDKATTMKAQWTNPNVILPSSPTRSGYTFSGWYTAASGGTKVTSDTKMTGNMTIYAQWSASYTVTYNPNGGSGGPGTASYSSGATVNVSYSPEPVKSVYVTFDANTGKFSVSNSSTYKHKIDLKFIGWNDNKSDADSGTAKYKKDGSGTQSFTITKNVTLYAVYTSKELDYLPTIGNKANQVKEREDYKFEGASNTRSGQFWTTTKNGTTQVTTSTKISKAVTFYAKWEYRVYVSPNGGKIYSGTQDSDGNPKMQTTPRAWWKKHNGDAVVINKSETYVKDSKTKKVAMFKRTGAKILGLDKSSSAEETASYPLPWTYSGNTPIVVYAVWKIKEYHVKFHDGYSDEGHDIIDDIKVKYGQSVPDASVPKVGKKYKYTDGKVKLFGKPGFYYFAGWSGDWTNVTEDRDLEAIWQFAPIWICKMVGTGSAAHKEWIPYTPKE